MDYGVNLCDHKRLREISCKYNIPIIHDAAHSFASKYENSFIGNQHQFTISFDPVKCITCIDGGAIILDKKKYEKKAQAMRLIGMTNQQNLCIPTIELGHMMSKISVSDIIFQIYMPLLD